MLNLAAKGTCGLWIHRTETALGKLHDIALLGFDYIAVKVADGRTLFDPGPLPQLLADAASISLPVVAWCYTRPNDADVNGAKAIAATIPAGVEHLILDCETEWEIAGSAALAHALCHDIAEVTDHRVDLHLSTFYDPALHPQYPYEAFLSHCQSFMPQSYVEGKTPPSLVVGRTHLQAAPMAEKAGVACIPTVNAPGLLSPLKTGGLASASVWLWDGDPSGSDKGVCGFEQEWKTAIAQYKA